MLLDRGTPFETADSDLSIGAINPSERGSSANTYIMHGAAAQRTVATYHLILAPTHACNLRCEHCYLPDHTAQSIKKDVALRLLQEWNDIAAIETPGRRAIFHVKGGEPLVYKPLIPMLSNMRTLRHLHFMMTTNGTLFRTRHWHALSTLNDVTEGHVTIVVSLDGATARTHELLRGNGTFRPTLDTIQGLNRRGIRTYVNSVLHADNIHEIDALVNCALEYGVCQLNFLPFVPKGFGEEIRRRQLPHLVVYERTKRAYEALPPAKRHLLAGSLPQIVADEQNGKFNAAHECVAAYRGLLYIKPSGDAFTCPNLEQKNYAVGNVHAQSLTSILDNLSNLYRSLHADGMSDRFICMGERKLYESLRDGRNLKSLAAVQDLSTNPIRTNTHATENSFCVSRNW
jgi:MoaA/NifB/PqqE/SkfB family radical SAM enzyme